MAGFGIGLWLLALVVLGLLALAWVLMPVLLLSIRRLLNRILQEQCHANALQEALLRQEKVEVPGRPAAVPHRGPDRSYP
jgi:hypothetical protein